MGYTTDFHGYFNLNKPLSEDQAIYLKAFSRTRRMKRDAKKTAKRADPLRMAVRLPVGDEGGYFVSESGFSGQDSGAGLLDYNEPPKGQPGLWCQWVGGDSRDTIHWDGGEKFYQYTAWLEYIIEHFLVPWGLRLDGEIEWIGECPDDLGKLVVEDNVVDEKHGRVVYG